jgi:multidrug resistance efflux pump
VGEQKTQAGTQKTNTGDVSAPASEHPTWAASATGRVEPKGGEVRITAEVPGSIEDIPVALNDVLKGGDLLIRLDDEDALTKVVAANAEAAVRSASVTRTTQEASLWAAQCEERGRLRRACPVRRASGLRRRIEWEAYRERLG